MTTLTAPDAEEHIPALPPKDAATNPRMTVVQSPTSGFTPATKEKATASGIIARLTARPAARDWIVTESPSSDVFLSPKGSSDFAFATRDSMRDGGGDDVASLSAEFDNDVDARSPPFRRFSNVARLTDAT
mmetsp:Transcript_24835/g.37007  ORF Transcript_24835/g.37007 Transcript_24835/m.37007 type:complete len:131 (+) Transcript_24835:1729-2121(+)